MDFSGRQCPKVYKGKKLVWNVCVANKEYSTRQNML